MDDSGFGDPRRFRERDIRDKAHDFEHAMKRMEHDLKHAERERMRAVKDSMKSCFGAESGPRTIEEVLVEIDSYVSYLEDLPKERLVPFGNKVDDVAAHLEKVRSSLKKQ